MSGCRFHGRHRRTELRLVERCPDCGGERVLRRGLTAWGVRSVPWALWALVLLLSLLLFGAS